MGGDQLKRILFKGDKTIWIVFFIICSISWVEVFSATSRQINESGSYWLPIIKHTIFLAAGIVVVWIMHNMKVTWIKKLTHVIYWLGLAGLIWAQFDEGSKINDSARWIKIMGLTFQPMELAKMGLIMVTALITSQHQDEDGTDRFALKRIAIYGALPILIILKENLSTAVIILLTLYAMMFVSRYPKKQMLYLLGAAFATCIIGLTLIMSAPKSWANEGGFKQKVITWQNRFIDAQKREPVTAENYVIKNEQRTYANIAIASSHIFGCGPGNSKQRDFIPHAYSDFIYAIIIEELGLAGGIIVLLLYMTILYRCGKIASKCEDPYPAFLVMGVGMIITLQALLHMYISVGDFVTGQPLPLISQGGTSVIINCVYIGMILSISRYAKKASANPKQSLEENENDNMNENIKLS
jgi:cell division protein FtsW